MVCIFWILRRRDAARFIVAFCHSCPLFDSCRQTPNRSGATHEHKLSRPFRGRLAAYLGLAVQFAQAQALNVGAFRWSVAVYTRWMWVRRPRGGWAYRVSGKETATP